MSTTSPRAVVTARIDSDDAEQLRQLADERDTTASRLVARAVRNFVAAQTNGQPADRSNVAVQ